MPSNGSPANDAEAGKPASGSRARRFQYGTGDRPLDGYTIKRGVGRGGFGEVYFATSDAGKEVALKLIRRNLDVELRGVRQCLNLKHPNLVALYDLRSDDADDQWVVMEYVGGDALDALLERNPTGLPTEEALEWIRGIAAGVAHLHASGVVHRDLKPGNIYLERGAGPVSSRVKIGDYGLSKFISTSRRSGQTESVGTVHYMAPEIAGGRYGREIDTYALGVILYELLTGVVPFAGESVGEVLMKHLTAEPDLSKVAEPFRPILAKALAKDPEARLSSVEELIAMLPGSTPGATGPVTPTAQRNAAGEPVMPDAMPPEATPQAWMPVSRPPHTDHPTPAREPLWAALVELLDNARARWAAWPVPPLAKGVILFGGIGALFLSGTVFWLPMMVLPFYFAYYLIWLLFLQPVDPADAGLAQTVDYKPTGRPARRKPRYNWRAAALAEQANRSPRQKLASLTGSMLVAALIVLALTTLAAPALAVGTDADPTAFAAWFAIVGTLGTWGVLIASHIADSRVEDFAPRRALNLAAGLGLGAVAAGLTLAMGDGVPYQSGWSVGRDDVIVSGGFDFDPYEGVSFENQVVAVPLVGSMIYFGVLFALVRWWRSTDYVRRNRIGFWSIASITVFAWLITCISWYPQPTGAVLAGVIALAVQSASAWCPPSRRTALARAARPEAEAV